MGQLHHVVIKTTYKIITQVQEKRKGNFMKIGLGQLDMTWQDKEVNKIKCEKMIVEAEAAGVDLLVFPEMTLTGVSNDTKKIAEPRKESMSILFFKKMTRKYDVAIAFGLAVEGDLKPKNRLCIAVGGKVLLEYDKIHPFSLGKEDQYYSSGRDLASLTMDGVGIGAFICYDLRFPEIFQASSKKNHAIIVIANWPKEREETWKVLLKARAMENQCYIIGVNRTGVVNRLVYNGGSAIIDPNGNQVTPESTAEELIIGEIDTSVVEESREYLSAKMDRRENLYRELLIP